MIYLYSAISLSVLILIWLLVAADYKAKGRNEFMQHWIGATSGCAMAIITAILFYADAWYFNVGGFIIFTLAVNRYYQPRITDTK